MTEQQWDASLDALLAPLKPENWERDPPVLVCCDRCWPPVILAQASRDDLLKPQAWQLDIVTRLGTKYVRDPKDPTRRSTRKMMKDPPTPPGTDRPQHRGVTLRCRRCKRVRNHSLRRIYELAEAAELAEEDRIYP
jgi:hypothetical protein